MACFIRMCTCTAEIKTLFYRSSNLLESMYVVHKKKKAIEMKKNSKCVLEKNIL